MNKKNQQMNPIALRVDVSKNIGLGHIKRLIELKNRLKHNKFFWLIGGDIKIIKDLFKKNNFIFVKNENQALKFIKKNNIKKVIIDISHNINLINNKISKIQNKYLENNIKLISFDHPYQKIISHISIIPYFFDKKKIKKNKNSKLFLGPDFFLHNIVENRSYTKNIKNILIVVSGTDPKNIGFKIYNMIKDLNYNFKVILGENYENIKKNNLNKKVKNLILLKRSKNINKEFSWSDIVICGEGHIKYEAIFANKPLIIAHQFNYKDILINEFLKLNICLSIGKFTIQRKKNIKLKNKKYITNKKKITIHRNNTKKLFNKLKMSKKIELMIEQIKKI